MSRHRRSVLLVAFVLLAPACVDDTRSGSSGTTATDTSEVSAADVVSSTITATTTTTAPVSTANTLPTDPAQLALVGGGHAAMDMAVDGTGAVWVNGPWDLTRLDPATGEATTWSLVDDPGFGDIIAMASSDEAGVWLVSSGRVRRFDGQRFVVDVELPVGVGFAWPMGFVADGSTVWVARADGVLDRWEDGTWTTLDGGHGGPLALDADGNLWSGDCEWPESGPVCSLSRFDGATWQQPGDPPAMGTVTSLVPDGGTGIWVTTTSAYSTSKLHHFDGTAWNEIELPWELMTAASSLAIADSGAVWVTAENGVGRLNADGTWTIYGPQEEWRGGLTRVATTGDTVVVTHGDGADRFDGSAFQQLWTDPAVVPALAGDLVASILAVSTDEVWVFVWNGSESGWHRYHDGTWSATGPQGTVVYGSRALVAADGAVWAVTPDGVVRFDGTEWTVISHSGVGDLAEGPDGTVWFTEGQQIVGYRADGTRTPIGYPTGEEFVVVGSIALSAGSDGSVWMLQGGFAPAAIARWSAGEWVPIAPPFSDWQSYDLLVNADGAVWASAIAAGRGAVLARLVDGQWTVFDVRGAGQLEEAPDGSVCLDQQPGVACFDEQGEVVDTLTDLWVQGYSIAPDGAVWVNGEQIARLPRQED